MEGITRESLVFCHWLISINKPSQRGWGLKETIDGYAAFDWTIREQCTPIVPLSLVRNVKRCPGKGRLFLGTIKGTCFDNKNE